MAALAQILLGNLQFHHVRGLLNLVKDGTVRLTGLEIQRTVLGLQDDVVTELAVKGFELRYSLLHTVFTLVVGTIDKAAPHDDALVRLQGVGQHVGTIGMGASEVARAGLSFAVSLDQETAEVGD